jgi:hypothetical protein
MAEYGMWRVGQVATTGVIFATMVGMSLLLAYKGWSSSPLLCYYVPLGTQSLLFMALAVLWECTQASCHRHTTAVA